MFYLLLICVCFSIVLYYHGDHCTAFILILPLPKNWCFRRCPSICLLCVCPWTGHVKGFIAIFMKPCTIMDCCYGKNPLNFGVDTRGLHGNRNCVYFSPVPADLISVPIKFRFHPHPCSHNFHSVLTCPCKNFHLCLYSS